MLMNNSLRFPLQCLLFACSLLFALSSMAQEKVTVQAYGRCISRDLTPGQTKRKAIEEAKRDALNKAGVSESVQVSDFLYQFEDNEKFQEIFQGFTSTETGADVLVEEVLDERKNFDENGNMVVEVEIKATVFKHKENRDPSFTFQLKGIDEFYDHLDFMRFDFIPRKDGYLKIFNVNDDTSLILYPYEDPHDFFLSEEKDKLFERGRTYDFPISELFDPRGYFLQIEDPGKMKEFNLLIFVFTKKDFPFTGHNNVKDIMSWIYNLPVDERAVKQVGFVIRK